MLLALLQFSALAAVIIIAGIVLAHYADAIAEATGWGRLLVGSILLAGATSLPELSVDLSAIRLGLADLAVGDLLGSSLMNLMILAIVDLTTYSAGKMLSRTAAAHALSGVFSMGLTGIVGIGLLTANLAPGWEFLGVHLAVWVVAFGYLLGVRIVFLDQQIVAAAAPEPSKSEADIVPTPLWQAALGFAAAAMVVLFAGPYLAESAGTIAALTGLGNTFVGTTLVALCTSLPELAASVAAARMGAIDLAVGNVFGSNAFNMLLFFPLDLMQPGSLFAAVQPVHAISALAAIVATSVVIIGQLYQVENRTRFIEPDAIVVLAIIFCGLAIVYYTGAAHVPHPAEIAP